MEVFHCPTCNTELYVGTFDVRSLKKSIPSSTRENIASKHTLKGIEVRFTFNEVLEFFRNHDLVWTPRKFYIVIDEEAVGTSRLIIAMLEDKYPQADDRWTRTVSSNDSRRILERIGFSVLNWN